MAEPCRSYERREIDWGGCRCQAFLLAGEAGRADPVCALSPDHGVVEALRRVYFAGSFGRTELARPRFLTLLVLISSGLLQLGSANRDRRRTM